MRTRAATPPGPAEAAPDFPAKRGVARSGCWPDLLYIVEGSARVQAWGDAAQSLEVGDTAVAPPGEKHWHGASAGGPMTQLAVTSGEVTWMEDAAEI